MSENRYALSGGDPELGYASPINGDLMEADLAQMCGLMGGRSPQCSAYALTSALFASWALVSQELRGSCDE